MKKTVVTLLFSLVALVSHGQQKAVEELINEVYGRIVPAAFCYYNLANSSFAPELDEHYFRQEGEAFLKNYPDFPLAFFLKKSSEATVIKWSDYQLVKAKTYTPATRPRFLHWGGPVVISQVPYLTSKSKLDSLASVYPDVLFLPVRHRWRNKGRQKELAKALASYDATVSEEDRICYRFSTPLLSQDGQYALVTLNETGTGATYVFKKTGGKWREIFVFKRWVS